MPASVPWLLPFYFNQFVGAIGDEQAQRAHHWHSW